MVPANGVHRVGYIRDRVNQVVGLVTDGLANEARQQSQRWSKAQSWIETSAHPGAKLADAQRWVEQLRDRALEWRPPSWAPNGRKPHGRTSRKRLLPWGLDDIGRLKDASLPRRLLGTVERAVERIAPPSTTKRRQAAAKRPPETKRQEPSWTVRSAVLNSVSLDESATPATAKAVDAAAPTTATSTTAAPAQRSPAQRSPAQQTPTHAAKDGRQLSLDSAVETSSHTPALRGNNREAAISESAAAATTRPTNDAVSPEKRPRPRARARQETHLSVVKETVKKAVKKTADRSSNKPGAIAASTSNREERRPSSRPPSVRPAAARPREAALAPLNGGKKPNGNGRSGQKKTKG